MEIVGPAALRQGAEVKRESKWQAPIPVLVVIIAIDLGPAVPSRTLIQPSSRGSRALMGYSRRESEQQQVETTVIGGEEFNDALQNKDRGVNVYDRRIN